MKALSLIKFAALTILIPVIWSCAGLPAKPTKGEFSQQILEPLANEKAKESLKRVGLEEYAEYSPLVLSVGQQQRVSMARATVSIPMLLLGDEPTGSLDSENGDKLMQFIVSFSSHNDSTIILVTHNSDYLPMSSHRIFIHDGVVAEEKGAFQADMNSSAVRVEEMIKVANAVKEAKLKKKNKKK